MFNIIVKGVTFWLSCHGIASILNKRNVKILNLRDANKECKDTKQEYEESKQLYDKLCKKFAISDKDEPLFEKVTDPDVRDIMFTTYTRLQLAEGKYHAAGHKLGSRLDSI